MRIYNKITQDTQLALKSVFLVVNAFIWYFLALLILQDIAGNANPIEVQLIWAVHFGTLAISLIIGAMLVNKIGRSRLFVLWTLIGVISPLFLLSLNSAQTPIVLLVSFLFAVSAGLGMPNCMEYFKRSTITGSRGRYAGLILLFSGLGLFALRMFGEGIVISAVDPDNLETFCSVSHIRCKAFYRNSRKKLQTIQWQKFLTPAFFVKDHFFYTWFLG